MKIQPHFAKLTLLALFTTLSFNTAAKDEDIVPPVATTKEAKIKQWNQPEKGLEFWDIKELKRPYIDTSPTDRADGISVSDLRHHTKHQALLLELANEIAEDKHGKLDSLLIAHKDKLVFESYYRRGRIDLPHPQSSATKAYIALALGRAIQLGYLTMADLDQPLINFIKGLDKNKLVDGAEKVTLNHALSMRSGIRLTEQDHQDFKDNPELVKGQQQIQSYLERSAPITKTSQSFKYGSDPSLVMQVLNAVVPGTVEEFITKELLNKMGITDYGFSVSQNGIPSPSSMSSRAMLKWGQLAMAKGKWKGEQLIPQAFIEKAKSRILYTGDDSIFGGGEDTSKQGYGYYWWGVDLKAGTKRYFSTSAQGGGGQYIILIEELDLMIIATGHDRVNKTMQLTAERILPAFI